MAEKKNSALIKAEKAAGDPVEKQDAERLLLAQRDAECQALSRQLPFESEQEARQAACLLLTHLPEHCVRQIEKVVDN